MLGAETISVNGEEAASEEVEEESSSLRDESEESHLKYIESILNALQTGSRKKFKTIQKSLPYSELQLKELFVPDVTQEQLEMDIHAERIRSCANDAENKLIIMAYYMYLLQKHPELHAKTSAAWTKFNKQYVQETKSGNAAGDPFHKLTVKSNPLRVIFEAAIVSESMLAQGRKVKESKLDPLFINLANDLKSFIETMDNHLKITGGEVNRRVNQLKDCFAGVKGYEATQAALRREYAQISDGTNTTRERQVAITELKHKLAHLRASHKHRVGKLVATSYNEMEMELYRSKEKQRNLKAAANRATLEYEALLARNIRVEKQHLSKRSKIELKLSIAVAKFDRDMGELENEKDTITEGLETAIADYSELQCLYDEQEVIYDKCKALKEADDAVKFGKKLRKFVTNRAATVIQKTWRSYKIRKHAKTKSIKANKKPKRKFK